VWRNPARQPAGFTILEVLVVLSLVGLILFAVLPRPAGLPGDDPALRAVRWIVHTVAALKREALLQQGQYTLHLDPAAGRFRVSSDGAAPNTPIAPLELKRGVRLASVSDLTSPPSTATELRIRFFPDGHSDRAVIHLAAEDGRRFALEVEPFLAGVTLLQEKAPETAP